MSGGEGCLMLRIKRADGDNAMHGTVPLAIKHRAMMLAVAAAACRKASVRILRECQQRRNQREREGREQQDGEEASHGKNRTVSVYVFVRRSRMRLCFFIC